VSGYNCFACGYEGETCSSEQVGSSVVISCPDCGTLEGEGFGFAENEEAERRDGGA